MYRLENNVEWTNELKNAFKHNVTRAKILYTGAEINEQNNLKDLTLTEQRYISNLGFIGTATAKKLEINLIDLNNSINLEDKEFIMKLGADYNGSTYYINYGNFIVDKAPEIDATNGKIRIVAYDYMIKFNKPFVNRVTYPCTLLTLLQDICSQAGVILGSLDFANKNFVVQDNQFEGATLREVLQNIAKCAFSWARIGQDNKLYLDFNLIADNTETVTIDDYKTNSFKKATEYYGPINQVTYADSNIQGQEERVKDQQSIDENGLKELVIYDNLFAYTPEKRSQLIQAGTRLLGLRYMPITQLDLIGLAYLDCCDIINIGTLDNETFESRVFNHTIKYTGILTDGIVTEGTSNNEETYKNTATTIFQNMQTRITVDKANKIIQSVIEEVEEQDSKISEITQTVDDINARIDNISEFTREMDSIGQLHLENTSDVLGSFLELRIYGNMEYVYPSTTTYPSAILYPVGQYINIVIDNNQRGHKSQDAQTIHFDLLKPLLYYDETAFDEIYVKDDTAKLIRRVGLDNNGNKYKLQNEVVTILGEVKLKSFTGNTYVYVAEHSNLNYYGKYLVDNDYMDFFTTKVETESKIEIAKDEINMGVSATYETKTDAQTKYSQILLNEDSITTEVNKKVNNSDFGTKIQQNAEAVKYAWNQISQYIQLEIINNKVCLAIRDSNNKLLMTIDQDGQHFYNQNKQIVETKSISSSNLPTLFFNVDGDNVVNNQGIYNSALGFSVSMTSQSDGNKYYYPMFYWGRLDTNQNQGVHVKEKLIFDDGDESASQSPYIDKNDGGFIFLVKDGSNIMVRTLNGKTVAIMGQGTFTLLDSYQNPIVQLYQNQSNTYTLDLEQGKVVSSNIPTLCDFDIMSMATSRSFLYLKMRDTNEEFYFEPDWTSDARLKENIETSDKDSLELIKKIPHYSFDWKKNKKHEDIGYIAQELENIDKNLVNKHEITDENDKVVDYDWTINERYIIANLTRAVQQQQELIDDLYSQLNIKKKKNKVKKEKYKKDFGEKTKINFKYEKEKLKIQEIKEKLKGGKSHG